MRKGAVIPLSEIESRLLECLATRYMSQRELAGRYEVQFHLKRRAFMYHLRRLVRAIGDREHPVTSLVRYRIARDVYWCKSDDPRRGDLDLASKLKGDVRDVFPVGLPDLVLQHSRSKPPGQGEYFLRGYPSLKPYPQLWAVFYRVAGEGRLEAIRPRRGGNQRPMRLAWLPAELWDEAATAPTRIR